MKKLFLFSAAVLIFLPAAAYAQGAITIIHEDGSKDVVDLSKKAVDEPPPAEAPPPAAVPSIPPAPSAKPAETLEFDDPPVAEKAVKTKKPKPQKPAAKPRPKPAPPVEEVKPVPPPMPVQRAAPMGKGLSKKQAIRIALDYAPPSSDVAVLPTSADDGNPALAVRFKTENGYTDVILDNETGKVLDTQKFENTGAARPGYLQ